MVNYLKKLPPFGVGQRLPEDKILELVEFSLLKEWYRELTIQKFDSATQGLTYLVELCERLNTSEEIFQAQGEGNKQNQTNNQSAEYHQPTKSVKSKGPYQAANLLEEDANKKKTKK